VQAGSLYDNWVWEDSQDAIIAGAGEPQVRAGAMRILATLPDVTVKSGTSAGQPTLVLTAGPAELGDDYVEQLTVNASTGAPMFWPGGTPGQTPGATVSYQVSRVTLGDIAAGEFSRVRAVCVPGLSRTWGGRRPELRKVGEPIHKREGMRTPHEEGAIREFRA
jgi:hypothetical protein